jgi:hypothetical protein
MHLRLRRGDSSFYRDIRSRIRHFARSRRPLDDRAGRHLDGQQEPFRYAAPALRYPRKTLMIDVNYLRQSFIRGDLQNVGLVRSAANVADGLSKPVSDGMIAKIMRM